MARQVCRKKPGTDRTRSTSTRLETISGTDTATKDAVVAYVTGAACGRITFDADSSSANAVRT